MTTIPTVPADADRTIYNRAFWVAYAANVMLVMGNALTFRFAEFVQFLGGTESVTGEIVRVGLLGSLVVRLVLGQAIDGLGVRRVWTASTLCFVAGCALFIWSDRLGPLIYIARILFTVGMSSMFACSIYHIQNQVPPYRRTEVIGSLGSSGFVGMIAGTQLGDLLFYAVADRARLFAILFCCTVALGIGYFVLVERLTRGERRRTPVLSPAIHRLAFRYWPGPVVLVALTMGASFTVTTVFLTRYATAHGIRGIGAFFAGYAISAFVFRWVSRTWSTAIGRHRVILLGLLGHTAGFLLLITVRSDWGFVLPSLCNGFGHALLFPCVISLGAGAFPPQYRGTGTTVILAFVDLGTMVSAPLLGRIIETDGFTRMYLAAAAFTSSILIVYGALTLRVRDLDGAPHPSEEPDEVSANDDEGDVVPMGDRAPVCAPEPVTCRRA